MSTWIPISERLPTREDADETGNVLKRWKNGDIAPGPWNTKPETGSTYVAWLPLPRYTPPKPSPTDNEGEGTVSGQFWVVWAENGGTPVVQHPNEASATFEAERLARLNPDKRFYVLEAIGLRCVTNMMRVDLRSDEVPF